MSKDFRARYGLATANLYKGTPDCLRIPGKDSPLYDKTSPERYDELRVQAIDERGEMTDAIEVWIDRDTGLLWIIDGRSRWLDVLEVNRRRLERGAEPVLPYIIPFHGTEKEAILRVRQKNYHRRVPKPSHMGIDIVALRRQGCSWEETARALHQDTKDAEQWCRKLIPLAYCCDEVRDAFDQGEFPRAWAVRFGGPAIDGSKQLSKKAQLDLLKELREEREKKASAPKPATVGVATRHRLRLLLGNGAADKLNAEGKKMAKLVQATLARIDGDKKALRDFPEIESIFEEALKKPKDKEASAS